MDVVCESEDLVVDIKKQLESSEIPKEEFSELSSSVMNQIQKITELIQEPVPTSDNSDVSDDVSNDHEDVVDADFEVVDEN